jgi:hypothetical protein
MARPNSQPPTILHPIELATVMQHVLHRIAPPVHLISCSSQEEFLRQLLASIKHENELVVREAEEAGLPPKKIQGLARRKHDLLIPTLRQLANAESVKVTFCETVTQLLAYLSVYQLPNEVSDEQETRPTIALLNPVSLHRNGSSFSAQGLSRTFASAVEAAARVNARLLVAECSLRAAPFSDVLAEPRSDDLMYESAFENEQGVSSTRGDPWEEQVSILNITTKSFGAGERGWVGRTVKIRSVAERWFVFKRP